ncbi:MAG: ATP-dependent RNA helicase HrpA, partial [Bifidobacteriaceae bacterium]|nr:ATP-dependent RNA helicase HrpA [Bifidobacteriaceae bacterium]
GGRDPLPGGRDPLPGGRDPLPGGRDPLPGGRRRQPMIAHTQPRRIAARSVAERIAQELGLPLGQTVGYQVRFTDHSSAATRLKIMTDGVLLAQIQQDPQLRAYDAIIVDEAHERSLNIDFLLGYLSNLLGQRPDLKVVITSATIDSELFAAHFGAPDRPAPVVHVTGRAYPVEVRYRPLGQDGVPADQPTAIVAAARELLRAGDGDILVFCSGEREIRDATDALAADLGEIELLPLYSRLSARDQHRVFEPHSRRRIVLATNVAETSLTVPGIHYVIDPGTARISRYSKATKVQRLPIEPISQAGANQRAGRCGRIARGVCIRLYSEDDFRGRPEFTEPEILRTSLASVILQMIAVGVARSPADVARFPFVQPPDARGVADGVKLLEELGAITAEGTRTHLTDVGRALARIPLDPRLGRMIVEAARLGVAREVSILAAALTIQDPRERPLEARAQADQAHARFDDPTSDFLSFLNLWEYLREQRAADSSSAFRRLVRAEFLNYLRIREWQDLVKELRRAARSALGTDGRQGRKSDHSTRPADLIHRAVLTGLLSQIGMRPTTEVGAKRADRSGRPPARRRPERGEYQGARGAKFAIHPASALKKKPPAWIMAAELVETSRLWARVNAAINPEWVEAAAPHLARRTYAEPRWAARRGQAVITERVLVYGLPVVAGRVVALARVDPALARELFIRHALVEGEWTTHHRFFRANRELLDRAEELAARSRSTGYAISDEALFDFYDQRVPAEVVAARHFDAWWKQAQRSTPDLLSLTEEALAGDALQAAEGFPDHWVQGPFTLPLTYEYAPGTDQDGLTVHIPVQYANQISPSGFDWQVPGLRQDLIAGLIKALPKRHRAELLPARDTARQAVERLRQPADWPGQDGSPIPLVNALTQVFEALRGVHVPVEAWQPGAVPAHLRVNFLIEDPSGRVMSAGSDLRAAVAEATEEVSAAIGRVVAASRAPRPAPGRPPAPSWERSRESLTTWDFGDLPAEVAANGVLLHDAVRGLPAPAVRGFPALVPGPAGVALKLLASQAEAAAVNPVGLRELLLGELALPTARLTSYLPPAVALPLAASSYQSVDALVRDAQAAVVDAAVAGGAMPRTQAAYEALRGRLRGSLEQSAQAVLETASDLLVLGRRIEAEAEKVVELAVLNSVVDIKNHLASLLGAGFLTRAGLARLPDLRRYLKGDEYRLPRLGRAQARESQALWLLEELRRSYDAALAAAGPPQPPALAEVPWMLEELRISLLAQPLGTAYPISEKRIRRALGER